MQKRTIQEFNNIKNIIKTETQKSAPKTNGRGAFQILR